MNAQPDNPAAGLEAHELARLQAQMLRPGQQINIDGSFELGWGAMVLCSGLVPYINGALPKSVWSSAWMSWVGYLPLLFMCFAMFVIPKVIKRFITWPRIGYVANPNEVKFTQLLMLMVFGLALGFAITLPFIMVSETRDWLNHTGPQDGAHGLIRHAIEFVVCATLTVYLGRKGITKRKPVPAAYDATVISEGLKQTAAGRTRLRVVKLTMAALFVGLPLLMGGIVLGLLYMGKTTLSPASPGAFPAGIVDADAGSTGLHWPQTATISFLVATNALLYLMGNGFMILRDRWKWLAVLALILGPIVVAATIPYRSAQPGLTPMLEFFPPPVAVSLGLVWVLSGATTLVLFLKHNPLPRTETP